MDIVLISQILIFPLWVSVLKGHGQRLDSIVKALLAIWLCSWFALVVLLEASTPAYIDFFDTRPGRIFFEYLGHPTEVAGLLLKGYPFTLLWVVLICPTLTYFFWRGLRDEKNSAPAVMTRIAIVVLFSIILIMGARSSFGHRPVNPSSVAFSSDQLLNDLALNSTYKILYSLYSLRHESDAGQIYEKLANDEVIRRVKTPGSKNYINDESIYHQIESPNASRKNIVIIVEESLGARFVGRLGGDDLTPNLDRWSERGIWFTHLYATGIRSARGLEAIVSGFPPSSAKSVLKLPGSQSNFYTAAETLGDAGYTSTFVYGGEAHFDNMSGFFLGNGFDRVIDQNDYKDYRFSGSWGVSDQDLFDKLDETLRLSQVPNFIVAFTSSFHSPYEFPDKQIDLVEEPKASKRNAVKYADHALGEFLDRASVSEYWQDSIFLIVADHDERPRGRDLVPIKSYHIPGLILGDGVDAMQVDKIASQIDLLPTLLHLAGVSATVPLLGQDVMSLASDDPGRAMMQYGDTHAYMVGEYVVINRPELPTSGYVLKGEALLPAVYPEDLGDKALAWALLPGLLYKERLYGPVKFEKASVLSGVRSVLPSGVPSEGSSLETQSHSSKTD